MSQQLPPPQSIPAQINVTRTKSSLNVNIILPAIAIVAIFGICAITAFRDNLVVAIERVSVLSMVLFSGWGLLKLANGGVTVTHKAKLLGIERSIRDEEKQILVLERQEREAKLWQLNYRDIGTNGTIAFNPATGATVYIPAQRASGPVTIDSTAALLPESERTRSLFDVIDNERHIAIVGSTGDGKSTTLLHIVNYLNSRNPNASFLALDPHLAKTPWPPFVSGVWDYTKIFGRINWAYGEMEKRRDPNFTGPYRPIFVVMDEVPGIMEEANGARLDIEMKFKRLIRESWKFGFKFVIATQSTLTQDNYINTNTRQNFVWIELEKQMTLQNKAHLLGRDLKPIEIITLAGPYHAAALPAQLTDEERIAAAFAPGRSFNDIARAAGLVDASGRPGASARETIRDVAVGLGYVFEDGRWVETENIQI